MARKPKNLPILGEAFNPEQMNMGDVFRSTAAELEHYMPESDVEGYKSRSARNALTAAACAYARVDAEIDGDDDRIQIGHDALNDAESLLSEWAQTVERHDYIYFVVDGPFAGFRINIDSAIEDADWNSYSNGYVDRGNPHQPGDGAGLEVFINDHGNVTAWFYGANGHKREIFSVV